MSRGEEFLGRETTKGLVIYLALEERRADVRSHFRLMGADGEENLKIFAELAPADGLIQLRKTADHEKPILIIVDTLARLARIKDLNDYSQTTSGLEPFLAIAREVGAHVILLHHAKKGKSSGIDSVLGSTGITGTVDTIINLHRSEKYRTISSIQRVGEDIEDTVLNFDSNRRWTTLGGSKQEAEIERAKYAVRAFLSEQTSSVEEKTIDDGVEIKRAYRKKALRQLVDEGKVERSGAGKKGSPYLYKISGFLVPSICEEPENQKQNNSPTHYNDTSYSGSKKSTHEDSAQLILNEFPGAKIISHNVANKVEEV